MRRDERKRERDPIFLTVVVVRSALATRETVRISLATRFRSLTVKCREEAFRETETDPLPMAALDFAVLTRSEEERAGASITRELRRLCLFSADNSPNFAGTRIYAKKQLSKLILRFHYQEHVKQS